MTLEKDRKNWAAEFQSGDYEQKEKSWGDPMDPNDPLGAYGEFRLELATICKEKDVLEIGAGTGKWIQYLKFRTFTAVDIIEEAFRIIDKRYPNELIHHYFTDGYELSGISDESMDVIFSVDSLMRTDEEYILSYIKESHRVLRQNGVLLLHLPSIEKPLGMEKGFTPLTLESPCSLIIKLGFKSLVVDETTFKHGVILKAIK